MTDAQTTSRGLPRAARVLRAALPLLALTLSACASGATPAPTSESAEWELASESVELSCDDGGTGPSSFRGELAELALTDNVGADLVRTAISVLPRAVDVGLPAPDAGWFARKAPLFVTPGAQGVMLSVPDDGRQYLFWTSTDDWTGPDATGPDSAWATPRVTVADCADSPVSFFGGLLVEDPARCFTLTIEERGQRAQHLEIRGDGADCA